MDEVISEPTNLVFTVDAVLLHLEPLQASFQIKIEPAEPKRWQILYFGSPHDGIMVGDIEEFDSKVRGDFSLH